MHQRTMRMTCSLSRLYLNENKNETKIFNANKKIVAFDRLCYLIVPDIAALSYGEKQKS